MFLLFNHVCFVDLCGLLGLGGERFVMIMYVRARFDSSRSYPAWSGDKTEHVGPGLTCTQLRDVLGQ